MSRSNSLISTRSLEYFFERYFTLNKLYYGDNLDILRRFFCDETLDLYYSSLPFNFRRDDNQIYNNIG